MVPSWLVARRLDRRRQLLCMEKGAPFKLPKSSFARSVEEAPAGENNSAGDASSDNDGPWDGEELVSDRDLHDEDVRSTTTADDASSSDKRTHPVP